MKFAVWSFNIIEQLPVWFALILLNIFESLAYLIPTQFIVFAVSSLDFLYVNVFAFAKKYLYSSLSNQQKLDILCGIVTVLFDKRPFFIYFCVYSGIWFLTLQNSISFINLIRSSLNTSSFFTCSVRLLLLNRILFFFSLFEAFQSAFMKTIDLHHLLFYKYYDRFSQFQYANFSFCIGMFFKVVKI